VLHFLFKNRKHRKRLPASPKTRGNNPVAIDENVMDVDDYRIASKSDVLQGSTFYSVNIPSHLSFNLSHVQTNCLT
jgi:hypothetical protein